MTEAEQVHLALTIAGFGIGGLGILIALLEIALFVRRRKARKGAERLTISEPRWATKPHCVAHRYFHGYCEACLNARKEKP